MSIVVAGKEFKTLSDVFYVNGSQVLEAYANGVKVYPEEETIDWTYTPFCIMLKGSATASVDYANWYDFPGAPTVTLSGNVTCSFISHKKLTLTHATTAWEVFPDYNSGFPSTYPAISTHGYVTGHYQVKGYSSTGSHPSENVGDCETVNHMALSFTGTRSGGYPKFAAAGYAQPSTIPNDMGMAFLNACNGDAFEWSYHDGLDNGSLWVGSAGFGGKCKDTTDFRVVIDPLVGSYGIGGMKLYAMVPEEGNGMTRTKYHQRYLGYAAFTEVAYSNVDPDSDEPTEMPPNWALIV